MPGMEPRATYMQNMYSTTELHHQACRGLKHSLYKCSKTEATLLHLATASLQCARICNESLHKIDNFQFSDFVGF